MRTFPNTLVLHLDGVPDDSGDIFDSKGMAFSPQVVVSKDPGSNALSDAIGFATLHLGEDGNLYADITVLNFVEGPLVLYPSVCGSILERNGNVLSQTTIRSLGLTTDKNSDKRIQPITLPALEQRPDHWDGPAFEQPGEELNPKD